MTTEENMNRSGRRIWAVGSGKGGVGKSLISASLSMILSNLEQHVIAVDLDLGNANMHTCLGIKYPRKTILDFLNNDIKDLNEITLDTPLYNLKLISGAGGIVGSSNPVHAQKLKLMRNLEKLYVDSIVLDLGAGTSFNTIDFYMSATDHLLVTTPEITSVQSLYNFIRICVFRKLQSIFYSNVHARDIIDRTKAPGANGGVFQVEEVLKQLESIDGRGVEEYYAFQKSFRPVIIMNMVMKQGEAKLGIGLQKVVKRYLGVETEYAGSVSFDTSVRESLHSGVPHLINVPKSKSSQDIYALIPKLMGHSNDAAFIRETVQRGMRQISKSYNKRIVEPESKDVDPSVYAMEKIRGAESEAPKEQSGLFNLKRATWSRIAIDVGTTSTLIYVKGRGVVLNEPSLMSVEENSGKIVALGSEAKAMTGRAHSGIKIISPLESGAITDYQDVRDMIQEYIRRVKRSALLIRPGIVLSVPPGLTSVEKRAFREFVKDLGAHEIHLVYEPLAAAIGAGLPVDVPMASMIVNIGGGSISAIVISISGIVEMNAARVGGKVIDQHIVRYLKDKHNFLIGDQTAEWIKINFGQALKIERDRRFEVRGQDMAQGIPHTLNVGTGEIRDAIAKPVNRILRVILDLLERVPPELSGDLVDRGMTLTGGGAFLKGIDRLITERTGIKVHIAPNAITATVNGAGRMLDDFSLYKRFFIEDVDILD